MNLEYLSKTSDNEYVEKTIRFITNRHSKNKKLTRKDFDESQKIVEAFNQHSTNKDQQKSITIPSFEIENNYFEMQLPSGVFELVEINKTIKQILSDSDFELNIQADTISMNSVLTTSNLIRFISKLNDLLGFTNTHYTKGTHKSEKPVMITTTDKVHLKCDCVDGSNVNDIRDLFLFSFNLNPPLEYKTIKNQTLFCMKR